MTVAPPPMPGFQFQLESYSGKVRALGLVWAIYGGLTLVLSFVGLAFARAFIFNHFGPWSHGWFNSPFRPEWFGPAFIHFIWLFILIRAALLFAAGWEPDGARPVGSHGRDRGRLPQAFTSSPSVPPSPSGPW